MTGDRHGSPQVDYTVNPSVGFPTATGAEGSTEPVGHVLPAWDCIAGQQAALGILAAERHRQRTGKGQLVELALKDVALAMLGHLGSSAKLPSTATIGQSWAIRSTGPMRRTSSAPTGGA